MYINIYEIPKSINSKLMLKNILNFEELLKTLSKLNHVIGVHF